MQEIGVVSFQLESLPAGRTRFSCWLSAGEGARPVSGDGASEGEAVRLCLDRAKQQAPLARR